MRNVYIATSTGEQLDLGGDTNKALFKQDLKENVGKRYRIERVIPTRTLSQNAFYWAYLNIVEKETGNLADDLHEYFKRHLLPPKFIKVMGKEIKIPTSTTDLNKTDFSEYMDKISMETNVPIPTKEDLQNLGYISNY